VLWRASRAFVSALRRSEQKVDAADAGDADDNGTVAQDVARVRAAEDELRLALQTVQRARRLARLPMPVP
jgi:hypothetical protein